MSKVRVPVAGTVGKSIRVDRESTAGATIGTDLRLPNGSVPSLSQLAAALGVNQGARQSSLSNTIWKLIREVPEVLASVGDLTDPNEDAIFYWDDVNGIADWMTEIPDSFLSANVALYDGSVAQFSAGTFLNARISETNVTQHEAAIDHDALTNFVEAKHIDWSVTGAEDIHVDRISEAIDQPYVAALGFYTETEIDAFGFLTSVLASDVDSGAATDGFVLTADGAGGAAWEAAPAGGVTDHGALTGLADNDHPQYARIATDETITGDWTFDRVTSGAGNGVRFASVIPGFWMEETDAAADENVWRQIVNGKTFSVDALNDARTTVASALRIVRGTGNSFTEVELNATTLDFNGAADFSSTINAGSQITGRGGGGGTGIALVSTDNWTSGELNLPFARWQEADGTTHGGIRASTSDGVNSNLILGTGFFNEALRLRSTGSHSITGSLDVSSALTADSATIGTASHASGDVLLVINLDRPWHIKQFSTGASAAGVLHSTVGGKRFFISSSDDDKFVQFDAVAAGSNRVIFGVDSSMSEFEVNAAAIDFNGPLDVSGALTAASFGGIASDNLLDKSATEVVSGGYTFTADLLAASNVAGGRVQVGTQGSGVSGVFGSAQNNDTTLSYKAYMAYDAYWDDTADNWVANRTTLGRKFAIDMGYHINSMRFRYFNGTVSAPWADTAWFEMLNLSASSATFGVQTRVPVGSAGAPGLSFDGDPNTGLYNTGNVIRFATGAGNRATLYAQQLRLESGTTLMISETAAANGDLSGYGQWWVKNTAPNEPWFTNDVGTDYHMFRFLTAGYEGGGRITVGSTAPGSPVQGDMWFDTS